MPPERSCGVPPDLLLDWPDREALVAHLSVRFPLSKSHLEIAGRPLELLSVAHPHENIDQLMGEVVDGDFQWEPFWAQAWPSAMTLGQWMEAERSRHWAGQRVLDLGCGVGVCGCIAASLGAKVTLADYAQPAVLFGAANVWPWRESATARVVDWHSDRLGEHYDVILGADIVYEQRNWEALQRFFREHLAAGGELILTEPGRETGETFQAFLKQQGWEIQASVLKILENQRPLRLLLARLRAP